MWLGPFCQVVSASINLIYCIGLPLTRTLFAAPWYMLGVPWLSALSSMGVDALLEAVSPSFRRIACLFNPSGRISEWYIL